MSLETEDPMYPNLPGESGDLPQIKELGRIAEAMERIAVAFEAWNKAAIRVSHGYINPGATYASIEAWHEG